MPSIFNIKSYLEYVHFHMLFFSFSGTVVTGRVTRGKLKTGSEMEIIGYGKTFKAKVNGNSLIIIQSSGQENLYFICLYFVSISSFDTGIKVYFVNRNIVKVCFACQQHCELRSYFVLVVVQIGTYYLFVIFCLKCLVMILYYFS